MATSMFWMGLATLVLIPLAPILTDAYRRYGGRRVVRCPEHGGIARVRASVSRAAAGAFFDRTTVRIAECSHWQSRGRCHQGCIGDIEAAPLDRTLHSQWFKGQACALCKRPLDGGWLRRIDGTALLGPDGVSHRWTDVADFEHLSHYQPICRDCHLTATFERLESSTSAR